MSATRLLEKKEELASLNGQYKIDNLALSGGGVRGLCHLGVFQALEELNLLSTLKRISGSSIGALMGFGVALGFKGNVLFEMALRKHSKTQLIPYRDFIPNDPTNFYTYTDKESKSSYYAKTIYNVLRSILDSILSGGFFFGKHIEDEAISLIKEAFPDRENLTFGELHKLREQFPEKNYKDIYITATNITDVKLEVFSWETTPDMPIPKAIHCSMAVPGVYKPVKYLGKYYIDGGVLCNFPIRFFDNDKYFEYKKNAEILYNIRTLGVSLSSKGFPTKIHSGNMYATEHWLIKTIGEIEAMIMRPLYIQDEIHLNSYDAKRTIYLDTADVSMFDYAISADKATQIIGNARNLALDYLKKQQMAHNLKTILGFYSLFAPPAKVINYFKTKVANKGL